MITMNEPCDKRDLYSSRLPLSFFSFFRLRLCPHIAALENLPSPWNRLLHDSFHGSIDQRARTLMRQHAESLPLRSSRFREVTNP